MEEANLYPSEESKKPWQSKTLWVNTIMAIAAFFPSVSGLVTPEAVGTIFMVVNTVLRFTTSKKISVK
jgi:hypothetical protein